MKPTCDLKDIQPTLVKWVESRLGKKAMLRMERARRFIEEAVELAQAVGLAERDVKLIVDHVYGKPKGRIGQEIGGVYTTLVTLAQASNCDAHICALMECDRIHTLSPEKFQNRQKQNIKDGIGK
jgi:hypothetical protein